MEKFLSFFQKRVEIAERLPGKKILSLPRLKAFLYNSVACDLTSQWRSRSSSTCELFLSSVRCTYTPAAPTGEWLTNHHEASNTSASQFCFQTKEVFFQLVCVLLSSNNISPFLEGKLPKLKLWENYEETARASSHSFLASFKRRR